MTIQQHAEKFGARNTAQTLFRKRIASFGLFADDLPDTCEVADIIDSLEEMIHRVRTVIEARGHRCVPQPIAQVQLHSLDWFHVAEVRVIHMLNNMTTELLR